MQYSETENIRIIRYDGSAAEMSDATIVREESLEITINGEKKYFCMRMPGMDRELAIGLLYNEGIIDSFDKINFIELAENRILMNIEPVIDKGAKKIYSSSGSMSTDDLVQPIQRSEGSFSAGQIADIQEHFFSMQKIFVKTGAVHSAGFYTANGELISFAEDIGRHNAVDKCTGSAIISGQLNSITAVMLSSRISFEMIKKCFRTGGTVVAGVSAPTSAAIDTAKESGITLIGFLRDRKFNIYCHHGRIFPEI